MIKNEWIKKLIAVGSVGLLLSMSVTACGDANKAETTDKSTNKSTDAVSEMTEEVSETVSEKESETIKESSEEIEDTESETEVVHKAPEEIFKLISFEDEENHYKVETSKGNEGTVKLSYEADEEMGDGRSMKVVFSKGSWPGVSIQPTPEIQSWDFSDGYYAFAFDIINENPVSKQLNIKMDTILSGGSGRVFTAQIPSKEKTTIYIVSAMKKGESSLGMQANPPISGTGNVAVDGWTESPDFNFNQIEQITFWLLNNGGDAAFTIDNIRVEASPYGPSEEMYGDLVDTYGQYTRTEWEEKITSDEELLVAKEEEIKKLEAWEAENKAANDRTVYGGWLNEEYKQEAKGRFYTTKIGDDWTLIDPLGYPYFSTGVDILRISDMNTWVSSREFMFKDLPDKDSDLGEHYGTVANTIKPPNGLKSGEAYNFYTANLERIYGDSWLSSWADMAIRRFKAWGMTSIGNWSDSSLFWNKGTVYQFPYVADAWTHEGGSFNKITVGIREIADPFDPKFIKATEESIKKVAKKKVAEDPYCMGIYVDNEIGWGNTKTANEDYEAVKSVFGRPSDDTNYAKQAFIKLLEEKYITIDALNKAWDEDFTAFNDLKSPYNKSIPKEDLSEMMFALADQYYKTVDEAVEMHLPKVLYLGSRLAIWGTCEEVVDAAAQYVDVMSFNCYDDSVNKDFMDITRYDLPMIIGEFHFNANTRGTFAEGLCNVGTEEERGASYERYLSSALLNNRFVGVHWFQYYDQPVLGRAWDGENSNAGFVDVTDQPYYELVESARKMNKQMYDVKFAK